MIFSELSSTLHFCYLLKVSTYLKKQILKTIYITYILNLKKKCNIMNKHPYKNEFELSI